MDALTRFSYPYFHPERSNQKEHSVTFFEAVYLRLASLKGYGEVNKIIRCTGKWFEVLAGSMLTQSAEGLKMLQSLEILSRVGREIKGFLSILNFPKTTLRTAESVTRATKTLFDPKSSYKKKGCALGGALLDGNRMVGHLCRTIDLASHWGLIRCSERAIEAIRGAGEVFHIILSTTGLSKASYRIVTNRNWMERPMRCLHRKLFVDGCLNFLKHGLDFFVAILGIATLFTTIACAWWLLLISSTLLLILSFAIYYHRMLAAPQKI